MRTEYREHHLRLMPCNRGEQLGWTCHIDLANGQRLHSDNTKSFDSIEAAQNWAKSMINLAACPLEPAGQAIEQQLETNSSQIMPYADAMLDKYLPKATARHRLLLKYLVSQFGNHGANKFWDYFLSRAFAVTSSKFLSLCRDLVKAGLIRYWRFNSAYFMEFYLGPAWLSLEEVTLSPESLAALALGEQIATYRPWCQQDESYPGQKNGFPCADKTERNIDLFWQGQGMPANWKFAHDGIALVRIPLRSRYPIWHSTWHSGKWTHRPIFLR